MQFRLVEPFCRLVLQQGEPAAHNGTEKAVHGQVESGVVVLDGAQEIAHTDIDGKFFLQFAGERLLRGFAGFHLAARKFPPVLEVAVTALGRKNLFVRSSDAVSDDACHNLNAFHGEKCRNLQE